MVKQAPLLVADLSCFPISRARRWTRGWPEYYSLGPKELAHESMSGSRRCPRSWNSVDTPLCLPSSSRQLGFQERELRVLGRGAEAEVEAGQIPGQSRRDAEGNERADR